jgi:hypothetical protein
LIFHDARKGTIERQIALIAIELINSSRYYILSEYTQPIVNYKVISTGTQY